MVNSNKITLLSDLLVVEIYIKNLNSMNTEDIQSMQLPLSKSYLKILGIPYLIKDILINASIIETIIKTTHVFNNI